MGTECNSALSITRGLLYPSDLDYKSYKVMPIYNLADIFGRHKPNKQVINK